MHGRQVLYHLSHDHSTILALIIFETGSHIYAQTSWTSILLLTLPA
jgi:hypothetical protein